MQKEKQTIILYHGKCTDGFGGAYAAYQKFGEDAEYIPVDYINEGNSDHPLLKINFKGKDVFMIDVSADRDIIEKIQADAKSFMLLDHHKTAAEKLMGCPHCFFDMKRSGATIAWSHFHETPAPEFFKYIQDGDLWTKKYKETEAFGAVVHNMPHDFKLWKNLENPEYLEEVLEKGKLLRQQFDKFVQDMVDVAKPIKFMGHDIYISNCPSAFTSETGNLLAVKSGTFAICWADQGKNIKVSLRSLNSFDCSKIATHFGGGGHPQASAFRLSDLETFLDVLKSNENTLIEDTEIKPKPFRLKTR